MSQNKETIDAKVLNLFNTVRVKKEEIAKSQKPRWKTSCTIGFNPDTVNDRTNIQTCFDLNKLIDIYGFLLIKNDAWNKATTELNIKMSFKWMGYDFADWEHDIKARIAQVDIQNKKKELQILEERLDKLITVDQRREMELAAIEKEMSGQ